jgi:hypothetical protein
MTTDFSPQETARKLMERKADIEAEIVRLPACAASLGFPTQLPGLTISHTSLSLPAASMQEGHRGRLEAVCGL